MVFVRGLLSFVCICLMWYIDDLIVKTEIDKSKKIIYCVLSLIGCILVMSFIYLFV